MGGGEVAACHGTHICLDAVGDGLEPVVERVVAGARCQHVRGVSMWYVAVWRGARVDPRRNSSVGLPITYPLLVLVHVLPCPGSTIAFMACSWHARTCAHSTCGI